VSLVNALDSQLLKWRALIWSPDDLMTVLKRYLRESNESEMVVASRIGINRHLRLVPFVPSPSIVAS
jgi:hypothetical protein